jgi:GNAT superfamily N-acetyltransferase
MIRVACLNERVALEALQRRASLALEEYRSALIAHPDAIELPAHQIEKGHVFVATERGELTCFAAIELNDDGSAELGGLFLEPSRWRDGIGTQLVEAAVSYVAQAASKSDRCRGAEWAEVL